MSVKTTGKDGQQTADDTEGDEKETPLTAESVQKMIADGVNAAFTGRSQQMKKSLLKDVEDTVGKSLAPILGRLDELSAPARKTATGTKDDGIPDVAAAKYEDHLKRLETRSKELEVQLASEKSERDKERTERLRGEESAALSSALREAGVPEGRIRAAILLHRDDGLLGRADDGKVIYKVQRQGYVDELDVTAGVKEWLGSKEGLEFAPARGAAGSGTKSVGKPGQKPQTKEQKAMQVINAFVRSGGSTEV